MSDQSEPKTRRRDGAATKERILRESLRLFAAKGYDATSVKDIATAVGVADAALYRHYPSKEDIATAVFRRHYGSLSKRVKDIGESGKIFPAILSDLVTLLCTLRDKEPDVFSFILVNQHDHLRFIGEEENLVEEIVKIMSSAVANKKIGITNPNLAAAIALGISIQPAIFKLYGRLDKSLASYQPSIERAVFDALGVGKS